MRNKKYSLPASNGIEAGLINKNTRNDYQQNGPGFNTIQNDVYGLDNLVVKDLHKLPKKTKERTPVRAKGLYNNRSMERANGNMRARS